MLGGLCSLGSAATWSVTSYLVRTLTPQVSTVAVNAARSILAGLLLLGWVVSMGGAADMARISPTALLCLGGSIVLAIAVGDSVFFESARHLGLGRAMTVATSYPLVAVVLAAVFLGEAITSRMLMGLALVLGGIALIMRGRPDGPARAERFWFGFGAAVVAALAWGASVVVLKPPLREVDPITAQAFRLPLAGLILWATPWARGGWGRIVGLDRGALLRLATVTLLTAASSVLFVAGIKHAGVAVASVLSSTAPLFAMGLGAAFLGERVSGRALFGAALTMVGIAVVQA